jgi:hypothetical protein
MSNVLLWTFGLVLLCVLIAVLLVGAPYASSATLWTSPPNVLWKEENPIQTAQTVAWEPKHLTPGGWYAQQQYDAVVPVVWKYAYSARCHVVPSLWIPDEGREWTRDIKERYLQRIADVDVSIPVVRVWAHNKHAEAFMRDVAPYVERDIILLSSASVHTPVWTGAWPPHVLAWYAQNQGTMHPRAHALPLGLDFHTLCRHVDDYEPQLAAWSNAKRDARAWTKRDVCVVWDARPSTPQRAPIHGVFKAAQQQWGSSLIRMGNRPRNKTWALYGRVQFVASPVGVGWDCHRTWEIMGLGAVPIVARPAARQQPARWRMMCKLPIWWIDEWSVETLSPESLARAARHFSALPWDEVAEDVKIVMDAREWMRAVETLEPTPYAWTSTKNWSYCENSTV